MNKSVEEIIRDFRNANRPDMPDNMSVLLTVGEMRELIKYFDDLDNARQQFQN